MTVSSVRRTCSSHSLAVVDDLEALDGRERLNSLGILDGNNVLGGACFEVCDLLLPNRLADPLGIELLEL